MTQDLAIPWLSAGKPITAVALAQLWQQQQLSLDDPVRRWIPAFAARGKESITLRHILTHTGGFGSLFDLDGKADSSADALQRVCASRLHGGWVPGDRAAYQARSGWQVLGEVIRVISSLAPQEYISAHVLEPAGMARTWLAVGDGAGPDDGSRLATLFDTGGSEATEMRGLSVPYCSPGAGLCGSVDDLRRFYEMLLQDGRGPGGRQVLAAPMVATLTRRHRVGLVDETFRHVIDWGLGFVVDSNQYGAHTVPYGFGLHCSPRSFGHGGSQCCIGFADPEHGLAVALAVNGRPGEAAHTVRFRRTLSALYEDLELLRPPI